MIKALATTPSGTRILMLGISGENVRRLQDDKPIVFDLKDVQRSGGTPDTICIFFKEADADLIAAISDGIGPTTIVNTVVQKRGDGQL